MRTCILDGEILADHKTLHDRLAEDLGFPDWYGRNLDALYDCLTDLEEAKVVIRISKSKERMFEKNAVPVMRVLERAEKENPGFQVKREFCL